MQLKNITGNTEIPHKEIDGEKNIIKAYLTTSSQNQNREDEFQDFFETSAIGLHWVGPDGTILWANKADYELLGYSKDEYIGRNIIEFHDDKNAIVDILRRLKRNEKITEYPARLLAKDGSIKHVLITSSVLWKDGEFIHTRCFTRDITERKLTERKLEVLLSSINDHLVMYDKNWHYTFVNDAAAQVLGKTQKELLGKCIWDLFPDAVGNQYYQELHEAMRQQRAIHSEHYYPPFNKWFENNIYPFEDGVTVFSTDITARKLTEEALAKSQKQKDEFVSIASHELKTPITSIKAYAQYLEHIFRTNKDMKAAGMLAKMNTQLTKLTNLIGDLLDITRIENGKLKFRKKHLDFNTLVKEMIEETQRTSKSHIIITKLEKSQKVYADGERIGQVISNLLINAIKYSPGKNKIIIKTAIKKKFHNSKNHLVVSVKDFGIGLLEKDKEKIFERFSRVSDNYRQIYPGLGLGLYISSEIVKRHGGKIWVESEYKKGSTFFFSLPLKK